MSFKNRLPQFDLPLKFWIVASIAFINSVSFTIIIPILYPYAREFGLSDFQASLLTTVYAIAQFIATPVLGRLSDVFGRKPLLVASLLGTVLASLLASVAPAAGWLFFARILDGLTGGNMSIAQAVIADTTTPADRAKAFGLFDAALRLGFVTGPAISYFAQTLPTFPGISPLGMSFLAGGAIATVATVLTIFQLPETLKTREPFQLSWKLFGLGKILQSVNHPKLGRVFRLTFASGFTFTIFTFAFQPFFLNVLDGNAKNLAAIFMLVGIVGVFTQIFAVGPITKRFDLANVLCVAIAVRGLVFLALPAFPVLPIFLGSICFLGIANSFPMPLISAILSANSSPREQGEIQGINASYLSISNAFGPAVAGVLVSLGYATPFWVAGVLTLLAAVWAWRLKSVLNCDRRSPT
ncbi:MAG: MFS transporter [Cyanobacteriota bacterium]|nr:MFS transporter [Cyanobacteriota bacterium]